MFFDGRPILPKITLFWIVATLFLSFPKAISANTSLVSAAHSVEIVANSDLSGQITYRVNLTNGSSDLIDGFSLDFPFAQVVSPTATLNGVNIEVEPSHPISLNATRLGVRLHNLAIREGQSAEIIFNFQVKELITSFGGTHQLYLSDPKTTYQLSQFSLKVYYPSDFPKLIFNSSGTYDEEGRTIQVSAAEPLLVWWSIEPVWELQDQINLSGNENTTVLFNLIPQITNQDVIYNTLQNIPNVGTDDLDNAWAIVSGFESPTFGYKAQVRKSGKLQLFPSEISNIRCLELNIPQELDEQLKADSAIENKVRMIFDFIIKKYTINKSGSTDLSTVNFERTELTQVEYACVLNSLLGQIGVQSQIAYGYIMAPNILQVETNLPRVWVEANILGKTIGIDPALTEETGMRFFNFPSLNRLVMGRWNRWEDGDNILGLLVNSPRPRPQFITAQEIVDTANLSMTGIFPVQAFAGEFFSGTLTIKNNSNYIVPIDKLTLNDQDLSDRYLRLKGNIRTALAPQTSTTIQMDYLREPNFVQDGPIRYRLSLVPSHPKFTTQTYNFQVRFKPDERVLIAVLIILLTTILLLVFFISRALWKQQRAYKKALRQIYSSEI